MLCISLGQLIRENDQNITCGGHVNVTIIRLTLVALLLGVSSSVVNAQQHSFAGTNDYLMATTSPYEEISNYSGDLFIQHIMDTPLEISGVFGATLIGGFSNWKWGNTSFHFRSEGGFGKRTGSGGIDKLGHAFSGAIISDYITDRIRQRSDNYQGAAVTGALVSLSVMGVVEIFDGFSSDHGFSYEDIIADAAGIGFSFLRNTIPGMRDKIDFREEYFPSTHMRGFHPVTDYEGQKYLLALKFSGFETFQDTPLRFLELHAGYYTRGFSATAKRKGVKKKRRPYFAIGLNFNELFFSRRERNEHWAKTWSRFTLEHYQAPFTYVGTSNTY